jgi:hypothetical protein
MTEAIEYTWDMLVQTQNSREWGAILDVYPAQNMTDVGRDVLWSRLASEQHLEEMEQRRIEAYLAFHWRIHRVPPTRADWTLRGPQEDLTNSSYPDPMIPFWAVHGPLTVPWMQMQHELGPRPLSVYVDQVKTLTPEVLASLERYFVSFPPSERPSLIWPVDAVMMAWMETQGYTVHHEHLCGDLGPVYRFVTLAQFRGQEPPPVSEIFASESDRVERYQHLSEDVPISLLVSHVNMADQLQVFQEQAIPLFRGKMAYGPRPLATVFPTDPRIELGWESIPNQVPEDLLEDPDAVITWVIPETNVESRV